MEYMSNRITDANNYGPHVSQLTQLMDLEGLTMFGDSRGMTLFRDALDIDQNAYPEYLEIYLSLMPHLSLGACGAL